MGEGRGGRPAVTVTGLGRVGREPDIARATLLVEATRETAAQARSVVAGLADAVIAALLAAGVAEGDLHTASIDVGPAWEQRGGEPVRTGFSVSSRLAVTVRDLATVGDVIDAALGAGATGLDGVWFGLADGSAAAAEARRLAVVDARDRAETIAAAAGMALGPLLSVSEGVPGVPFPGPAARLMAADAAPEAATPVVPGRVEVALSVTAAWSLVRRGRRQGRRGG